MILRLTYLSALLFISFCLSSVSALAQDAALPDSKALYQEGIRQYQQSQWQEADNSFKKALMQDPRNPYILYNLGLAAFRLEHLGEAVAYWRKALTYSPGLSVAKQALALALEKTNLSQRVSEVSSWERFRELLLVKFRTRIFFALCCLLFIATAWSLFSYLGQRRRALTNETALPSLPYLPISTGFVFFISATLLAAKLYDQSFPRGTIIGKQVRAKSGPEEQASDLFDLSETTEVILRTSQDGWIQVSYPDGLTGWIPQSQVFQTSGEPL